MGYALEHYRQFNYDWGGGLITPTKSNDVSVRFKTFLTPFTTESYTISIKSNAGNNFTFDGVIKYSNFGPTGVNRYNISKVLNAFQTYSIEVVMGDWGGDSECGLYWETSSMSNQTIQANNLSVASDAASSPYQLVVNCPTGYTPGGTSLTLWVEKWGDGLKYGSEKWDDGNTNNGDGCSSDWTSIESSWVWSGGSTTSKDTWTFCTSGFYQNDPLNPTTWVTHCGDNKRTGTEKWDDGNTSNGDGWSFDCSTVESSWVCSGGSPIFKDIWTFCTSGFYQNDPANPTTWVTHCGDSKRAGSEKCDDGNIHDGDGWSSTWTSIESCWVWSGGTSTSKDTWTFCTSGFYQNDAANPIIWATHCGDGKRAGTEKCDDGNSLNEDGWSTDCSSIESGWVWSGGSPTSKDVWSFCTSGFYQNDVTNPTVWVPHWGDSKVAGDEIWDDGNNVNGDGWGNNWKKIEDNWIWINGSTTHRSDWSLWDSGYEPNSDHTSWKYSEVSYKFSLNQIIILATTVIVTLINLIGQFNNGW